THRSDRAEARSRRRRFHLQPFHVPRREGQQQPEHQPLHPRTGARGIRIEARAGRLRLRQDQTQGDRTVMLLLLAALPALFWDGAADTAPALHDAGIKQMLVPKERLAAWKSVGGIAAEAADLDGATKLLAPT